MHRALWSDVIGRPAGIGGSSVDLSKSLSLQSFSLFDIHVSQSLAVLEFFLIVSHVVFRAVVRGAKLALISQNLKLKSLVSADLVGDDGDEAEDQESPGGDHAHNKADLVATFEGLGCTTSVWFISEHLGETVDRTGVRLFAMEGATFEDLSRCHGGEYSS